MLNLKAVELKTRTKRFALDVLSFRRTLPDTDAAVDIGRQLSRSATAVAANYRAGQLTAIFAASSITARRRTGHKF